RDVAELNDALFRAGIGHVQVASQPTHVSLDGVEYEATTVDVGNPHAVVFLPADVDLESLDLSHPPRFDTRVYPAGTNIEFVRVDSDRSLSMRVFERGSGETMSCGTGVVATAAAQGARLGEQGRFGVDVPGGHLEVELDDSMAHLTGPAVIVAHGSVVLPDEAAR
ncbi:MAG: diaminopimelate epimerase, partial [Propionibacterium sp.]|nr:diaminopimelate epimerase [Propionibacterium sp.]